MNDAIYSVSVIFGPAAGQWVFSFRSREAADEAATKIHAAPPVPGARVEIKDHFGQHATFMAQSIHGVLVENLNQTADAQVLRGMTNVRAQAKLQQQVQGDPVLKFSGAMQPAGMHGMGPRGM